MIELKKWTKNNPDLFCSKCRLLHRWCYCLKIKRVNVNTKFHIIVHHRDWSLSSNTVNLAKMVMNPFPIYLQGLKGVAIPNEKLKLSKNNTFFLFPDEDSIPITDVPLNLNEINLIVPDGSWGQAKKFKRRISCLRDYQSVHIPFINESRYYLRKEKKEDHLCTFEAMAFSVGILEGEEKKQKLLEQLDHMVEATLKSRAKKMALQKFYRSKNNLV